MRAEYDTTADTIAIDLRDADRADYGNDDIAGAIVHIRSEQPIAIDLLNANAGTDQALGEIADRYSLDLESLQAAARAALAAPNRVVELDVHARTAA